MLQSSPSEKKNPLKKRTDAFARFLVRRKAYEARAREIISELERSNVEMARLAKKFKWWGALP